MAPSHPVSVLLSSLPLDFASALRQAVAMGFRHVDVIAMIERPEADREALADSGLLVCCAALGRGLPEEQTLDASEPGLRRAAVEAMKRQITEAAQLGARHAYLVSGKDASPAGLARFAEACHALADHAARVQVRLGVEHIPKRALPTAAGTLAWLRQHGHPNLRLLLDVGHCLITQEDPADMIRQADKQLGYIHFDDNDGLDDLHWPLLTGRLTEDVLKRTLSALRDVHYRDALTLELNASNPDPFEALRQGKAILERLLCE